jgi:hypothetical protein
MPTTKKKVPKEKYTIKIKKKKTAQKFLRKKKKE